MHDTTMKVLIRYSSYQYSKQVPAYVLTELKLCTFTVYSISTLTELGVRRSSDQLHPVTERYAVRLAILRTNNGFQTLYTEHLGCIVQYRPTKCTFSKLIF